MARLRPDCYPLEFRRGPLGHLSLSAPIGCANTRLDLASPRSRNHNLCRVAQAPQPGAAMKGTSLLLVLLLAKLAMAWGHASRSEEHTSELQSRLHLVCRLLLEKKNSNPRPLYGMAQTGR